MPTQADAVPKFESGFEAVGWFLAALLLAGALWLPDASVPSLRLRLFAVVAALAALNLIGHRLLPPESVGPLAYRRDDKAMLISLGMAVLLSVYLYLLPSGLPSLGYLYLLPMIGATLALQERVVFGGALSAVLAMLFLRAAHVEAGPFWTPDFAVRLAVFAVVSACLTAATAVLRKGFVDAYRLTDELALRLEQMRVFGSLARQSELTPTLDRLAARVGEIIADAVGTERHAIFLCDGERSEKLSLVGGTASADGADGPRTFDGNAEILRAVLETGMARVLEGASAGDERFRNMLVLPLRVRQAPIGVICLIDRRGDAGFLPEDVRYCELLSGLTASLLNGALLFRRSIDERRTVEQMSKLLIGRETRMRELKDRLREGTPL